MGKEIPQETWDRAEDLYIVDGMTYAQVAGATGISESQLNRRGMECDWKARRREYRMALRSIRRDTVMLRKRLIQNALESLDPQAVYAVARIEAIAARQRPDGPEAQAAEMPAEITPIQTPADAVDAIRKALEIRVNRMLAAPETVDLAALKRLKESFDYLEKMEAKAKPAEADGKPRGITEDTRDRIRKEFGI